jgi:hypothetical protein
MKDKIRYFGWRYNCLCSLLTFDGLKKSYEKNIFDDVICFFGCDSWAG